MTLPLGYRTYGDIKDVAAVRGKKHDFLGMQLDFSEDGVCHVRQDSHVQDIIDSWPENLKIPIRLQHQLCWIYSTRNAVLY